MATVMSFLCLELGNPSRRVSNVHRTMPFLFRGPATPCHIHSTVGPTIGTTRPRCDDGSSHTTEDSDNNLDDTTDTDDHGMELASTATLLRASARSRTVTIEMQVTDTGPGITPNRLPDISTPFTYASARVSRTRRHRPWTVDCRLYRG
jgi:hypothetical protein